MWYIVLYGLKEFKVDKKNTTFTCDEVEWRQKFLGHLLWTCNLLSQLQPWLACFFSQNCSLQRWHSRPLGQEHKPYSLDPPVKKFITNLKEYCRYRHEVGVKMLGKVTFIFNFNTLLGFRMSYFWVISKNTLFDLKNTIKTSLALSTLQISLFFPEIWCGCS